MLKSVIPKLPAKNLQETIRFYQNKLDFHLLYEFHDYLIMIKDNVEIHFFLYEGISKSANYGMCYVRMDEIDKFYELILKNEVDLAVAGELEIKPWNQKEFSITDNSGNVITFGESIPEEVVMN